MLMGSWTLLETSPLVCCLRPTLLEVSASEWHPRPLLRLSSSAVIAEVASSADLAADVTMGVASSAVAGVASRLTLLRWRPWPALLRWRPWPTLLRWHPWPTLLRWRPWPTLLR